jgi:biopolymer transport protein ExbB
MGALFDSLRRFLETGGPVLLAIAITCALLLSMIIERYWFLLRTAPALEQQIIRRWQKRQDRHSRRARSIRRAELSVMRLLLTRPMPLLGILVALCPLLGLLGTVTGMMSVFDVIAVLGTGNVRAMATGISHATVPTMAGMTVALPGLYYCAALNRRINRQMERLADQLPLG